jgi:hypothetical protein
MPFSVNQRFALLKAKTFGYLVFDVFVVTLSLASCFANSSWKSLYSVMLRD